jgi:hypothetical protein
MRPQRSSSAPAALCGGLLRSATPSVRRPLVGSPSRAMLDRRGAREAARLLHRLEDRPRVHVVRQLLAERLAERSVEQIARIRRPAVRGQLTGLAAELTQQAHGVDSVPLRRTLGTKPYGQQVEGAS